MRKSQSNRSPAFDPKQTLFEQLALVAKAAAHPIRLELLEQLAQGERTVEILADKTGTSVANASQHLQQLRRAGLVTSQRQAKFVCYRLASDSVIMLLGTLRQIAEQHVAEMDRLIRDYYLERDSFEPVTRKELMKLVKTGQVTVLDVRPQDEYELGHLPGAVNIPFDELKQRLAELDPGMEIVAYCRAPFCVMAFEAVAYLRQKGFNIRRLEDGYPQWRVAGMPVVRSNS